MEAARCDLNLVQRELSQVRGAPQVEGGLAVSAPKQILNMEGFNLGTNVHKSGVPSGGFSIVVGNSGDLLGVINDVLYYDIMEVDWWVSG